MLIGRIVTFYDDNTLIYAAILARALRLDLVILTMSCSSASRLAERTGLPSIATQVLAQIQATLAEARCVLKRISLIEYDGDPESWPRLIQRKDLVVSNRHAGETKTHAVIMPQREVGLFRPGKESLLLSIGDDELARRTYHYGLLLSKCLFPENGRVTLYHTTWRNPNVTSDNPFDHVNPRATAILNEANNLGTSFGITVRPMIRMDETVLQGIAEASLRSNAGLVVIARDPDVTLGDYAERLAGLLAGSVPLLILPYNSLRAS